MAFFVVVGGAQFNTCSSLVNKLFPPFITWFILLKTFGLHFCSYYSCFQKHGNRWGTCAITYVTCVWIKMQEFRFYFWQVDVFPAFKPPKSKITLMAESRKCEGSQSKCGGKSKQSVRHEGGTRRNNTVTVTLSTNTLCVSLEGLECTITPWVCFYIRAGVILRKTEAGHGKGRNWEQTLCLSRLSC